MKKNNETQRFSHFTAPKGNSFSPGSGSTDCSYHSEVWSTKCLPLFPGLKCHGNRDRNDRMCFSLLNFCKITELQVISKETAPQQVHPAVDISITSLHLWWNYFTRACITVIFLLKHLEYTEAHTTLLKGQKPKFSKPIFTVNELQIILQPERVQHLHLSKFRVHSEVCCYQRWGDTQRFCVPHSSK